MDGTEISTAHEPGVIVARKGRKILGEEQLVSFCAASDGSSVVSPTFIYIRHGENTFLQMVHSSCCKCVGTKGVLVVVRLHIMRTE